jgi:Trypsin
MLTIQNVFKNGTLIGGIERNGSDAEFRAVIKWVPHPQFNDYSFRNDIMILKLNESSTKTVQALNYTRSNPVPGQNVTVIGLGYISEDIPSTQNLLEVTTLANSDTECQCLSNFSTYFTTVHVRGYKALDNQPIDSRHTKIWFLH